MTEQRRVGELPTFRGRGDPWLGWTPTIDDLEGMPVDWLHAAVDELLAETLEETSGE
jgi:hypothetical protein